VADEDAALAAVRVAGDAFGRLDVVVKNAGYGDLALFEQVSSERFKALVDTNFYGVVNMTRAALPIMRKQKGGYILQISCGGGRLALAGSAAYHAAKWAVGGFTDAPGPGSGPSWRRARASPAQSGSGRRKGGGAPLRVTQKCITSAACS